MKILAPWLNGKPYYCKLCGAGYAEYVACELPGCELESEVDAMLRKITNERANNTATSITQRSPGDRGNDRSSQ